MSAPARMSDGQCQPTCGLTASEPEATICFFPNEDDVNEGVFWVSNRADLRPLRRLRRGALDRLRAVERYARSRGCRRRTLLSYFGEEAPLRCGACDRCLLRTRPHFF